MEARTLMPRRSSIVVVESNQRNRKEVTASREEPAEIVFSDIKIRPRAQTATYRFAAPLLTAEVEPSQLLSRTSPRPFVLSSRSTYCRSVPIAENAELLRSLRDAPREPHA